jgi:hypothetical protein
MLAHVAEVAVAQSGLSISKLPMIVGSAFGEMDITRKLLEMCFDGAGELSPARFQLSVHNASVGQLSIAVQNPMFSSAIAAGFNTVAMTFVEAQAWLNTHGGDLLVLLGDEALPDELRQEFKYEALAAAFVLGIDVPGKSGKHSGCLGTIGEVIARPTQARNTLSLDTLPAWRSNPCEAAKQLYRMIEGQRAAELVLTPANQSPSWSLSYCPQQ